MCRTVIVILRPVLPMVSAIAGRGARGCAGRVEPHVREDHPRVLQKYHLLGTSAAAPLHLGHIDVTVALWAQIQHDSPYLDALFLPLPHLFSRVPTNVVYSPTEQFTRQFFTDDRIYINAHSWIFKQLIMIINFVVYGNSLVCRGTHACVVDREIVRACACWRPDRHRASVSLSRAQWRNARAGGPKGENYPHHQGWGQPLDAASTALPLAERIALFLSLSRSLSLSRALARALAYIQKTLLPI